MRRLPTNLIRHTLGWLLILVVLFASTTNAETLCSSSAQNSVLVVIDMQTVFVTRNGFNLKPGNLAKVKKLLEEQVSTINLAKEANIPIVFIEYDGPNGDYYGETNGDLKAAVADYKDVTFIKKDSDGLFESHNTFRKDIVNYLAKKKAGILIMTGANGGGCVLKSIQDALDGDCTVVAYSKAIADFNFKDFIYPYVDSYSEIKPTCQNCSFKEIYNLDHLGRYMVNRPASIVPTTKNKGVVR